MTDGPMVFGQQRDPWFHVMTLAFAAMGAIFAVLGFLYSNPALLITGAGVAVVLATVLLPNYFYGRYELGEDAVHVRFYLTDLTIPYRDITSTGTVKWTRTFVMTAATSLKFVEVHYREGRHKRYISFTPADRERFVAELSSRMAQKSASSLNDEPA